MADMVQEFSAVTLSNEIMNYEIYMTAAIVTKMNEGSSLIIIQKFIIFFKSFNLHREHRNIVNHLGSRLISSGCSIHRLRRALYREPLLLPEETNRTHHLCLNILHRFLPFSPALFLSLSLPLTLSPSLSLSLSVSLCLPVSHSHPLSPIPFSLPPSPTPSPSRPISCGCVRINTAVTLASPRPWQGRPFSRKCK